MAFSSPHAASSVYPRIQKAAQTLDLRRLVVRIVINNHPLHVSSVNIRRPDGRRVNSGEHGEHGYTPVTLGPKSPNVRNPKVSSEKWVSSPNELSTPTVRRI
jgi:hypothetical protein